MKNKAMAKIFGLSSAVALRQPLKRCRRRASVNLDAIREHTEANATPSCRWSLGCNEALQSLNISRRKIHRRLPVKCSYSHYCRIVRAKRARRRSRRTDAVLLQEAPRGHVPGLLRVGHDRLEAA